MGSRTEALKIVIYEQHNLRPCFRVLPHQRSRLVLGAAKRFHFHFSLWLAIKGRTRPGPGDAPSVPDNRTALKLTTQPGTLSRFRLQSLLAGWHGLRNVKSLFVYSGRLAVVVRPTVTSARVTLVNNYNFSSRKSNESAKTFPIQLCAANPSRAGCPEHWKCRTRSRSPW